MDEKQMQAMLKIAYEAGRAMALEEWEKEAGGLSSPPGLAKAKSYQPKYRKPVERPNLDYLSRGPTPGAPATGQRFAQPGPRVTARFTRQQREQVGRKY